MAFIKKSWVDRLVQYPGRRRLTNTGATDVYDVAREEGLVTADGDAFSAASMNDLENRVEAAMSETVSIDRGGTGRTDGKVPALVTARTVRTNLASTSTASFDGSTNITPGVTGTLGPGNGGTGVAAMDGTDYGTSKPRMIHYGTSDMTAGETALASGRIYMVYE